jgi:hypothetical protein
MARCRTMICEICKLIHPNRVIVRTEMLINLMISRNLGLSIDHIHSNCFSISFRLPFVMERLSFGTNKIYQTRIFDLKLEDPEMALSIWIFWSIIKVSWSPTHLNLCPSRIVEIGELIPQTSQVRSLVSERNSLSPRPSHKMPKSPSYSQFKFWWFSCLASGFSKSRRMIFAIFRNPWFAE